jgi:HNH endonuclease
MNQVEYRDIPGFDGWYQAGSDGSIWSCRKVNAQPGRGEWHKLMQFEHKKRRGSNHLRVNVRIERGKGKLVHRWVHRLVLEAFVGACPPGMEACHNDGDPTNNRIDNLRWDTPSAHYHDRYLHGTSMIGPKNPRVKLNWDRVSEIRAMLAAGYSQQSIADHFGLGQTTISRIHLNQRWNTRTRELLALAESQPKKD